MKKDHLPVIDINHIDSIHVGDVYAFCDGYMTVTGIRKRTLEEINEHQLLYSHTIYVTDSDGHECGFGAGRFNA